MGGGVLELHRALVLAGAVLVVGAVDDHGFGSAFPLPRPARPVPAGGRGARVPARLRRMADRGQRLGAKTLQRRSSGAPKREDAARPEATEKRHAVGGPNRPREHRGSRSTPAASSSTEASRSRPSAPGGSLRSCSSAPRPTGSSPARRESTASCSARRRLRRPLLRLHGPGRDPGRDRPPEEGPPLRADRANAPADGVLRRGGRRASRRHRLRRRLRASTSAPSRCGPRSPAWCRGSRLSPAAASPATP